MSLLTLVQDSMLLCGFYSPSTVYSNTDPTVKHFVALSKVEGNELSRFSPWRRMKALGAFQGDGTSTTFTLPADFERFMSGEPIWTSNNTRGPLYKASDVEMIEAKISIVNAVRPVWRLFGKVIEFHPALQSGDQIKLEYRSKYWIMEETETTRSALWTADTDVTVLPEHVMVLGLVWRFKKSKGLDYAEDFRTYQIERQRAANTDGGQTVIYPRTNMQHRFHSDPVVTT